MKDFSQVTLKCDASLTGAQKMTAFLFARDLFFEEILEKQINVKLMFDEHNPTVPEEIVS